MKKSVPANLRHWIVWAVEAGFVFILIGIIRRQGGQTFR